MDDTQLYTIGDLSRRTGLSVKTIRFYSDAGVVPPTGRTHSGYRLYDLASVSRLELVRTLRELGAGLDEVRRVLDRQTTVSQLAQAHLALLEEQMSLLRTRRAVLRAVVKQDSTTEEMRLMHKLAQMSDDERNRIIDEFWDEVSAGLDVNPEFIAWMRSAKPNLPEDPSTEQLEAWLELAEMVRDPGFRELVRGMNAEQARQRESTQEHDFSPEKVQEFWGAQAEVTAAREAGIAPDSAQARDLIARFIELFPEKPGEERASKVQPHELADRFEQHDPRLSRYWELLGTINGWPKPQTLSAADTEWLVAALRAAA